MSKTVRVNFSNFLNVRRPVRLILTKITNIVFLACQHIRNSLWKYLLRQGTWNELVFPNPHVWHLSYKYTDVAQIWVFWWYFENVSYKLPKWICDIWFHLLQWSKWCHKNLRRFSSRWKYMTMVQQKLGSCLLPNEDKSLQRPFYSLEPVEISFKFKLCKLMRLFLFSMSSRLREERQYRFSQVSSLK